MQISPKREKLELTRLYRWSRNKRKCVCFIFCATKLHGDARAKRYRKANAHTQLYMNAFTPSSVLCTCQVMEIFGGMAKIIELHWTIYIS